MDVIALEDAAGKVGLVGVATLEPFDRDLFVSKRFQEGKWKGSRLEGGFG